MYYIGYCIMNLLDYLCLRDLSFSYDQLYSSFLTLLSSAVLTIGFVFTVDSHVDQYLYSLEVIILFV